MKKIKERLEKMKEQVETKAEKLEETYNKKSEKWLESKEGGKRNMDQQEMLDYIVNDIEEVISRIESYLEI